MDRETLLDYALGALTREEEARVVEHLRTDPVDAAFVRDVFESLADVAMTLPASDLTEDVLARGEAALLERIRAQPDDVSRSATSVAVRPGAPRSAPRNARRSAPGAARARQSEPRRLIRVWWPALGAIVIAAVALVTLLGGPEVPGSVEAMLQRTCAEEGVVCEPLLGEEGGAMGTIAMRPDAKLLLVMATDPPPGEAFQAWQIMAGEPSSLGVFSGRAMEVDGPLSPGSLLGITLEPRGGSPRPTTAPVALMQL